MKHKFNLVLKRIRNLEARDIKLADLKASQSRHRAHWREVEEALAVFVRAARRPASDLISTTFAPLSVASVLGSSVLPRFALSRRPLQRPGMRTAVLSRLIVRGLGNFRRSGRCWLMVLERLSVVCIFRTVIVRVRANAQMQQCTHAPAPYTHGTDASTYVHPHIRCASCSNAQTRYREIP
jgi:hypothetical protein